MIRDFTDKKIPDQSGRTIFVTGANTGLGFEASLVLAEKSARVLMGCRNPEKAAEAKQKILDAVPGADLELIDLDLGDLANVRAAAQRVAQEPRLDVLVNNAGIMIPPKELTKDGFESQFGVNHLGGFALTGLLLPKLEQQAGSRVVLTSSNAHKSGRIIWDDINAEQAYQRTIRYSMSKVANLLHMLELARRLEKKGSPTIATACHPGGSATELGRHLPLAARIILPIFAPLLNSAAQGAWGTLAAATAPEAENGMHFGPQNRGGWTGPAREETPVTYARNEETAQRLWDLSIEMTGVNPGI